MSESRVRIRRGRRTDFSAAMGLLAQCELPVPAPERATLHRFRAIVADLGTDFYLYVDGDDVAGLIHVSYSRQFATHARAHLNLLLVAPTFRRRGVGTALLKFARRRAEKRGCALLTFDLDGADTGARAVLSRHGMQPGPTRWGAALSPALTENRIDG